MSALRLRVPDGPPQRLDRFLASAIGTLSRRAVQQALAEGRIRVAGRRPRKGEMLAPGIEVEVEIESGPEALGVEPELAIPILHEDDALVVLDKPAGVPSHARRATDRGTVANFLVAHFPEIAAASEKPLEAGLVHRLDTGTSGVLAAARTREAWNELRRQFQARDVVKIYVALVAGRVAGARTIATAIAPDRRSRRRVRVVADDAPSAREALTHVRPLGDRPGRTLVEVEIETGMMHQIRAHLASIGHPVVGDPLYGGEPAPRLMLHALRLELRHPVTGRRMRFESELPAELG